MLLESLNIPLIKVLKSSKSKNPFPHNVTHSTVIIFRTPHFGST